MNVRDIREILYRKRVAITVFAYLLLSGIVAFNFRVPIMRFVERRMAPPKQERVVYERFPVYAEKDFYRTAPAISSKGRNVIFFDVPIVKPGELEVGLVRLSESSGYDGEFHFRVYQKKMYRRSVLLETCQKLHVGERISFRLRTSELEKEDRTARIFYELTAADQDPESKNEQFDKFLFLVPNFFRLRGPKEFNVLLVSFDTLRADHLGCYGYKRRDTSPNIDVFANKGVLFTQAISAAPWTTPSHYSLFTALYPSAHGNDKTLSHRYLYSQRTLVNMLKDNGYYTTAFTGDSSVSSRFGFADGFNIYNEFSGYANTRFPERPWGRGDQTQNIFNHAMSWLENNRDTKFFMFLHNFEVHDPYESPLFLNDDDHGTLIEQRKALYDGDIRKADSFFGELIRKLNSLDLMSNTIIVFLSDHGDDFYDHYRESDIIPEYTGKIVPNISIVDHAHSLYDEIVRVPLIFYIPGLEPAKSRIESQVRLIDVMPTVLDYLDITPDVPIQGLSLMQLILSGSGKEDLPALSEATFFGPKRMSIRKDGYKYIKIPDLNDRGNDITYRNIEKFQLFDLTKDPKEQHNIYDQNRELAEKYDRLLEEQMQASLAINKILKSGHDPRLAGEEQELDEDIIANLKALGYLN